MKKKTLTAIAIAAILIVAGVALCAVSVDMGAQPKQLFSDGSFTLDIGDGLKLGFSDNNIGISGTRNNGGGSVFARVEESGSVELRGNISEVVIDWVSGSVTLVPTREKTLSFSETAGGEPVAEKYALDYRIDGGRLYIDYAEDKFFGISFGSSESKDLVVYVPESVRGITVETVSANVEARELSLTGELSLSTTSGAIIVNDGSVGAFNGDTVSGAVTFSGSCGEFDANSTSGQVAAVFSSAPGDVDVETVSGYVELVFPKGTQFELEFDTVSGKLKSGLAFVMEDGSYKHGRGGLEVDVSTVSGDCTVNEH